MRLFSIFFILAVIAFAIAFAAPNTDPDLTRSTTELIASRGYQYEELIASTSDGYGLSLIRIPNPGKPVVLLQHGLMDTASTWVINSAQQSLAYILFDAGFDVFMCNSRGNSYSQSNNINPPSKSAFWTFNFDQHAYYDVPACIQQALTTSNRSDLAYVAHSQGSTIGFASFAMHPSLANQVKLFVALAPVTYLTNQASPMFSAMSLLHVDTALNLLPYGEFVPTPSLLSVLLGAQCTITPSLCNDFLGSLFGKSTQLDKSRMNVYTAHWPDLTSRENMIHWIRNARSGDFANMDGQSYNVSAITIPTAVYYGTQDYLGDPSDVQTLLNNLGSTVIKSKESVGFAHMDYVWAYQSVQEVYSEVVPLLTQYLA